MKKRMEIFLSIHHHKIGVRIEDGLRTQLPTLLPARSIIIVDERIRHHVSSAEGYVPIIAITTDERQKRIQTIELLAEQMLQYGADRTSTLVAVGGGVIGDMVGFLASIFMRGIPFIQFPTTLLSMVDASIGGKTGVDLPSGKNLLGTFWQPQAVYSDPGILATLPQSQFSNGMAEVIKHGVIDRNFFQWLEQHVQDLERTTAPLLAEMIATSIAIKKRIVEQDEREQGMRAVLNLGHTFGHALEQMSGYTLPHGQAVAIGTCLAAAYAQTPDLYRIRALFQSVGLQTAVPHELQDVEQMIALMSHDKKSTDQHITLVLPRRIGEVTIERNIDPQRLREWLATSF